MHKDIAEILVTEQEIHDICVSMGKTITQDYANKNFIVVGLLKGCVPFLADFTRLFDL